MIIPNLDLDDAVGGQSSRGARSSWGRMKAGGALLFNIVYVLNQISFDQIII